VHGTQPWAWYAAGIPGQPSHGAIPPGAGSISWFEPMPGGVVTAYHQVVARSAIFRHLRFIGVTPTMQAYRAILGRRLGLSAAPPPTL